MSRTLDDLKITTELLTVCQCCIDAGIGMEAQQACIEALKVLSFANEQLKEMGRIELKDEQLGILRVLHDCHDQQRILCNLSQYAKIIDQAELIVDNWFNKWKHMSKAK